jgi:MIP family channel proteins
MSPLLAELLGTAILVILGDGVVANVVLQRTKGNASGWIVITTGWALAVTLAVYSVGSISGAHLNPAVTIGLATIGTFPWSSVPGYVAAQVAGGFLGAIVVWLAYLPHWEATADPDAKLAVFCTAPAIRKPSANVITEIIGTFMLVLAILAVISPANLTQGSDWARGLGPAPRRRDRVVDRHLARRTDRATRSIRRATSGRGSRTPCCRSRRRAAPTGATRGCRSWDRSSEGVLGALCYQLIWK